MDLHYLKIFNTVAQVESFTKASDILHISQPALSIQIKKLEEQIGLKLFNKIGNKIYLSENGHMLYEYTQKLFALVEEIENNLSNKKDFVGGTLNIGGSNTPGTYILPSIIGEFKKIYPNVNINVHIGNTSEIELLINNGTLDIAVNGGGSQYNKNIHVEKLIEDELLIVASPNNALTKKATITIDDIRQISFIVHKTDSQLYTFYKKFIDDIHIAENISMYLGSIDAMKRAVIANLGVSLMPLAAVQLELEMGLLRRLRFEQTKDYYPYNLIYNKNKYLSNTTKKFIDVLKDNITHYSDFLKPNFDK